MAVRLLDATVCLEILRSFVLRTYLVWVTQTTADFLRPQGYDAPSVAALLREVGLVGEVSRQLVASGLRRGIDVVRPSRGPRAVESPVLLVPGFFLSDATLMPMAGALRRAGHQTWLSRMQANVGCTMDALDEVEQRLEHVADRTGQRVQVVGHSLGGLIARGVAVRRPDLVEGIVTLGSPMQAPGAHHPFLSFGVEALARLSSVGIKGLMQRDCVAGECARAAYDVCSSPLEAGLTFTAFTSPRDGVVDHKACVDPQASVVTVRATHLGLVVDPKVIAQVARALAQPAPVLAPASSGERVA